MLDRQLPEDRTTVARSSVLEPDVCHDVLVLGAGLIGSSIAWLLSRAGCNVVLMDAGRFGGEASAAGAGMLALGGEYHEFSPAARFAMESLAIYPAFIAQLEQESGLSIGYRKSGAIDLAYDRDRWHALRHRAEEQRHFGIAAQLLCSSSMSAIVPGLNLKGLLGAVYYPDDACVAPLDLLRALRVVCEHHDVRILENSPVKCINAEGSKVVVTLPSRRITGRNLVLAAGAWSSEIPLWCFGKTMPMPVSIPVKGHLVGYRLQPDSLRPILRSGHHYVVQRKTGFTIAGSSEERCGFNRNVHPDRIREIRAGACSFYTPLSMQEPTREWVGFRPASECHEPTIRRVAGSNVWLAYGHYRNGILLTPATAHRVAGQILDSNCRAENKTLQSLIAIQSAGPGDGN